MPALTSRHRERIVDREPSEVERVCQPGALLTSAVVREIGVGDSCEASAELIHAAHPPPAVTVVSVALEPGLATAQVRVRDGSTVPVTPLRDGRRLVSFSDAGAGRSPLVPKGAIP